MLLKGLTLHVDFTAGTDAGSMLAMVSVIDAEGDVLWTSGLTPVNAGETLTYGPFSEEVSTEATFNAGPTPTPPSAAADKGGSGKSAAQAGGGGKRQPVASGR